MAFDKELSIEGVVLEKGPQCANRPKTNNRGGGDGSHEESEDADPWRAAGPDANSGGSLYPLKDCGLTPQEMAHYRQHLPRTAGGVTKCFKHNCHVGCPGRKFSHSEYKYTGGLDWAVKLHGAAWGGTRFDDNGKPTEPFTTSQQAQAFMAQVREQVKKKQQKLFKEV